MNKRVLYVSYDGMTDPLGQSQVIPYLAGLSQSGNEITIVSAEKKKNLQQHGNDIQQLLSENNIQWYPVIYSNKIPGVSAFLTYRRLLGKSLQLHQQGAFGLIHCRSYIPSLIGLLFKRKHGVKFIFDMRGFWADERVEGEIWNIANPFYKSAYRYFKKKEKEFLTASDAVVSLTESGKQEILSWKDIKLSPQKITVIPCCADLDLFSSKNISAVTQQQLRSALGIGEKNYVLCYTGSTGTWYLLEEMLRFFKCLLAYRADAIMLIISADDEALIRSAVEREQIDQSKIRVRCGSRTEMPALISICQASVFFIRNTYSKKASSPTKMGELMSMGIPIVCNGGIGDIEAIMEHSHAGILMESLTNENYILAINKLLATTFSAEEIRNAASLHFSLPVGVSRYQHIYQSV